MIDQNRSTSTTSPEESALSASGSGHDRITVLHVDDDSAFAALTSTYLERIDDRFTVQTETRPVDALDVVTAEPVDCIVSDYDMPRIDGLEFLDRLRQHRSELPFILFTGKGNEEIASEAITAGVTDYLQKETGTDQYRVLANRIHNSV